MEELLVVCILRDEGLIFFLAFQDEVDDLPNSPPSPFPLGDVMAAAADLFDGVRDTDGKSDPHQDREIQEVIANETDLFIRDMEFPLDLLVHSPLVDGVLIDLGNVAILRTPADDRRFFGGDNHRPYPPFGEEIDAESILDIETFELISRVAVDDPAVRQNPVDIQDEEFHLPRTFFKGGFGHCDTLCKLWVVGGGRCVWGRRWGWEVKK